MGMGPLAAAIQAKQEAKGEVTPFPDNAEEALWQVSQIRVPRTDSEAAAAPQAAKWNASDMAELSQIIDSGVLTPVDKKYIPPNASVVPCKMVRSAKGKVNGLLFKFKSRLVAKGFRQKYGLDYDATYASVAIMSTIKMLLAVAAHFNMVTFQFDVEAAFLLPDLEHVIYISGGKIHLRILFPSPDPDPEDPELRSGAQHCHPPPHSTTSTPSSGPQRGPSLGV